MNNPEEVSFETRAGNPLPPPAPVVKKPKKRRPKARVQRCKLFWELGPIQYCCEGAELPKEKQFGQKNCCCKVLSLIWHVVVVVLDYFAVQLALQGSISQLKAIEKDPAYKFLPENLQTIISFSYKVIYSFAFLTGMAGYYFGAHRVLYELHSWKKTTIQYRSDFAQMKCVKITFAAMPVLLGVVGVAVAGFILNEVNTRGFSKQVQDEQLKDFLNLILSFLIESGILIGLIIESLDCCENSCECLKAKNQLCELIDNCCPR